MKNEVNKIWSAAIYLRLSKEDKDKKRYHKNESDSISNQKNLINDFLKDKADIWVQSTKIDDGYSGVSFERPAFIEMLEDIKLGIVNCVIVKDISRFGRNYIEVGNYLEQVFPFLNMRFIAINDDYDSNNPDCVGSIATVFKTLYAHIYSQDLSQKVIAGNRMKAKQGQYINPFAPYGYKKSIENKYKLEIDKESAEIVSFIFESFIGGENRAEIARKLNKEKILTPKCYKEKTGCLRNWDGIAKNKVNFWTSDTVLSIIKDVRYKGTVIYGKKNRIGVGTQKCIKSEENQVITVDNMHDCIISTFDFEKAQRLLGDYHKTVSVLSYLDHTLNIKCGYCNRKLSLRDKKKSYFCKTSQFTDQFLCTTINIPKKQIQEAIIKSIQLQAECVIQEEEILEIRNQYMQKEIKMKQKEANECQKILKVWTKRYQELFQTYLDKQISDQDFIIEKQICSEKKEEQEVKYKNLT